MDLDEKIKRLEELENEKGKESSKKTIIICAVVLTLILSILAIYNVHYNNTFH